MRAKIRAEKWVIAIGVIAVMALAVACSSSAKDAQSLSKGAPVVSNAPPSDGALRTEAGKPAAGVAQAPDGSEANAQQIAGTNGGPGGGTLALPSQLDRKMIMVATVDVTLDDVSRGFEDVGNIAALEGGFIASSSFGHNGDRQTASVTIRVPADKYGDAIARVRKLGEVRNEQGGGTDVTEQYTDLQSRLRNLQATEQTYLGFLNRAADLGDVLTVQDRINQTRAEIEQVQGRLNLVQNQTDLATITVHLDPPVAGPAPKESHEARSPVEVARDSFDASLVVLAGIATVGLAVLAFSWWLLPVAVVVWFVSRRQILRPGGRQ